MDERIQAHYRPSLCRLCGQSFRRSAQADARRLAPGRLTLAAIGAVLLVVLVGCSTTGGATAAERARAARAGAAVAVGRLEGNGSSGNGRADGIPGSVGPAAQTNQTSSSKSTGPPAWLLSFPTNPNYFIGVGGAPDNGNPTQDVQEAQKAARNALASEIETTIHSTTSLKTRDNSKGDTQNSLTVLIDEQVNLRLEGIQLVDSYHSKKLGYWFYYRLPRSALDARPTIAKGVDDLVSQLSGPATVSFATITYSDTGLSSAFSLYLEDQVLLALRGRKQITVSSSNLRSMEPVNVSPPRGGSTSGGTTAAASGPGAAPAAAAPRAPSSASPAVAKGVVLSGTFFGASHGKVSVFLRLTDPKRHVVVAESSFGLNESAIPTSVSLLPANYSAAIKIKKVITLTQSLEPNGAPTIAASQGFHVRLWTNRGQDPTYLGGEDLVVNFSTNRDCYIKMYHIDVHGNASLILPNRFSRENFFRAGSSYRIPPPGAPYRFLLGAPYGTEFITVIASTRPFSGTERSFTNLGPATRSLLTRGLRVEGAGGSGEGGFPGQAQQPAQTAQAIVSYTILPRQGGG